MKTEQHDPLCLVRVRLAAIREQVAVGGSPTNEQVWWALAPLLRNVLPPLVTSDSRGAVPGATRRLWGRIRWALQAFFAEDARAPIGAGAGAAAPPIAGAAASLSPSGRRPGAAVSKKKKIQEQQQKQTQQGESRTHWVRKPSPRTTSVQLPAFQCEPICVGVAPCVAQA